MKSCPVCRSDYTGKPPRCPLDGSALVDVGPDLLAGRVVAGRYRLIDRRGTGATAEVYRTHDVRAGTFVAVRLLSAEAGRDPYYRAALLDQVRAWQKVSTESALIPLLDVVDGGIDGRGFVVTEFLQTPSLPHVLVAGPVTLAYALEAGVQLATLLEHLHAHDVLARDLRAGAVFLSTTPGVSVRVSSDALASGPVCPPDPTPAVTYPAPHVAVAYASPERIRGESGASPGDIYALGALLFEMLTGHPVFMGTAPEVVTQHLQSPPPVLRHVDPTLPMALEALLARMLAKVPRFRPTATEVVRELRALGAVPS